MQKRLVLSLTGVALLGALAWYFLQPASRSAGTPRAATPPLVSLARAQSMDVPVRLEANGYVSSLNTVDIRPQVSNVIDKVHIREGQFVQTGEVLFTLDQRANRVNLQRAQAQLAKDRATLADLERQLSRSRELLAQRFISQSAVDTIQSQFEAQRATVQASQAAVEAAQVALGYDTIRASSAGRAGAISVYPGSLVQPSSPPLVTISQLDPIGVSFTLPETELNALLAAQRTGEVKVNATLNDGKPPLVGKLSFVDNAVDAQSGTIRVKAVFPNDAQRLWPGQYVTVNTTVRELKDAVVIPQAAIITGELRNTVYVVDDTKTARPRPVEMVHGFNRQAVVTGLKAGETVVVDGKHNLRPGVVVREMRNENAPAAAGTSAGENTSGSAAPATPTTPAAPAASAASATSAPPAKRS